ncbi:MAG: diguanylate cyclase [Oleiphilaceae bacterium]|nr:diguanylate cyclase [Oleiphilaceae bacterium]
MNSRTTLFLTALLFLCNPLALASTQQDKTGAATGYINLGQNILYWRDTTGTASLQDAILEKKSNWQRNEAVTPNLGVDSAAYWFKQTLYNLDQIDHPLLVEIAYPALDHIDMYFLSDGKAIAHYQTGDHQTFHQRPIQHRNFVFPVPEGHAQLEIYLRVQTSGAVQVPLHLWSYNAFWEQDQWQLMGHTFFVAILLTIALYNLMLFLSMRDSVYFLYICYIAALTISQMGLRGLSFQLIAPDFPTLNERLLLVSIGGAVFFACLFARRFMSLQATSPRLNKLLLAIAGLALVQAIGGFFLPYAPVLKAGILITALACPLLLLTGLTQWLSGVKVARFFTLAWFIYLVGQFALTLSKFGLIPRTTLVEHGPEIGAAIEVILLSFALADRMNEERRKRFAAQHTALLHEKAARKAQEQVMEAQHRANEELEERVAERTQELREILQELSLANEKLQSLSTRDGLTQVSNRRAFDETYEREWRRCAREKTELSILLIDADHFKDINDHYGHLTGDECLKFIAKVLSDTVQRPSDSVARYGGEEFAVLLPNTSSHGACNIAEKMRKKIAEQGVVSEGQTISLSISIGVVTVTPGQHLLPISALQEADKALYEAKHQGRNRVVVSDAAITVQINDEA